MVFLNCVGQVKPGLAGEEDGESLGRQRVKAHAQVVPLWVVFVSSLTFVAGEDREEVSWSAESSSSHKVHHLAIII